MLASAVEEVLLKPPTPLAPTLVTAHRLLTLNLGDAPDESELTTLATDKVATHQRWAARLLAQVKAGQPLARTYPYPVEAWLLGGHQLWITLGGEPVVDYSLRFKREFGVSTWVTGYSNEVMAYIPSARVLAEDKQPRAKGGVGYEGNSSMYAYGMQANRWGDDVEDLIASGVAQVVQQVKTAARTP
jgi:neutral ceramidase